MAGIQFVKSAATQLQRKNKRSDLNGTAILF